MIVSDPPDAYTLEPADLTRRERGGIRQSNYDYKIALSWHGSRENRAPVHQAGDASVSTLITRIPMQPAPPINTNSSIVAFLPRSRHVVGPLPATVLVLLLSPWFCGCGGCGGIGSEVLVVVVFIVLRWPHKLLTCGRGGSVEMDLCHASARGPMSRKAIVKGNPDILVLPSATFDRLIDTQRELWVRAYLSVLARPLGPARPPYIGHLPVD